MARPDFFASAGSQSSNRGEISDVHRDDRAHPNGNPNPSYPWIPRQVGNRPCDSDRSQNWSRLSEQLFRVDKWSVCRG